MVIIKLLIIQLIIVFIIDLSGAITSLKHFISKKLTNNKITSDHYHLPPVDCSLCMTFWIGLFYLLFTHQFTIPLIGFVCLLAFLTPVGANLLITTKDVLTKLINTIYEHIVK